MRIIAGTLGGRHFESPRGHRTHPMSDKIRGALFNILGDLHGLTVLDAFAGSGAICFEAISRGAASSLAIDIDIDAFKAIQANIAELGLEEQVTVLRKNALSWARSHRDMRFDIVVADPPYDNIQPQILTALIPLVQPGGLFVLSWPGSEPVRQFPGIEALSSKAYGDAQLVFYRRLTD